jgi:hypothetical protein
MRKIFAVAIVVLFLLGGVSLVSAEKEKAVSKDTCRIEVKMSEKSNKAVAEVYIANTKTTTALTIPLRFGSGKTPITCDSISYKGTAVENFAVRAGNIDSTLQTLMVGLIADVSGSGLTLKEGTSLIARIYFTLGKSNKTTEVVLDTCTYRPQNDLKMVYRVVKKGAKSKIRDLVPIFDNRSAKIKITAS